MLLASAATLLMGYDALRDQDPSNYDRSEGILLLLLFAVFLYYTFAETIRTRRSDPFLQQASGSRAGSHLGSLGLSAGLVALGLVGLGLGGHLTVEGAVGIATALGAPRELIALTVVAIGTSLPELSASVMAARKGETDLAVGNIVGSNVFNLLFVLGVTAWIRPVPVPPGGGADLVAMLLFGALLLLLLATGRSGISRLDAALLAAGYLGYLTWRAT